MVVLKLRARRTEGSLVDHFKRSKSARFLTQNGGGDDIFLARFGRVDPIFGVEIAAQT